jgi:hypothetical protein
MKKMQPEETTIKVEKLLTPCLNSPIAAVLLIKHMYCGYGSLITYPLRHKFVFQSKDPTFLEIPQYDHEKPHK